MVFCDVNEANGKVTETELRRQYGVHNVTFCHCDVQDEKQLTGEKKTVRAPSTLSLLCACVCVCVCVFVCVCVWLQEGGGTRRRGYGEEGARCVCCYMEEG